LERAQAGESRPVGGVMIQLDWKIKKWKYVQKN